MENLIFGIAAITLSSVGYYWSFRCYKNNNYNAAIFLLILCGLLLRVYVSTDLFLHAWDERYHALVAKNLLKHPFIPTLYDNPVLPFDYRNWSANHIWMHKQPLPLWAMAGSMWLFGINEIALRIPSILLTTFGIWLTFSIARYFYNNKVGFIAAFLYSIHGMIIESTGGRWATDHIDIFFLFFIELAIFFAIKFVQNKNQIFNLLCGISIGVAILSKWLPALIVLPIWILLLIGSKKFSAKEIVCNFLILICICFITFIPWQIYIHTAFPLESQWEKEFNFRHITEGLDGHSGSFFYHFNELRINYGELIYLPLLWFFWKTLKTKGVQYHFKRIILLLWFLIPFLFFTFVKTKMEGYTLFAAPAIFIITAVFWNYLFRYKNIISFKWLAYTILFLLLALPVRFTLERAKVFQIRERNPLWTQELRTLNKNYENKKVVLFNSGHPIETMFYTDFTAYPHIPNKETLKIIIKNGYKINIIDNGNLDAELLKIEGVEIINGMKN